VFHFYIFILLTSIAADKLKANNKYKGPVKIGDRVSINGPSYCRGFYKDVLRLPGVIVTSDFEEDLRFCGRGFFMNLNSSDSISLSENI
jgi:hypothetical protein